jgi:His/Glu/Gln/Arg/opine family amino acid ABC transporter permease subunit
VTIASLLLGLAIGLAGAAAKLYGPRWLRALANTYTTVVRGVPDLLIIFIAYFGGTVALSKLFGRYVEVDALQAGIASLAFIAGAYATEIVRGAILSVPAGQFEGARSLGLSSRKAFLLVVLPQAWRYALPALGNQSVVLLKQTSLVSVVGLEELMRKAAIAAGATREPFTFYLAAAVIYLTFTGSLTLVLRLAQSRADRGIASA